MNLGILNQFVKTGLSLHRGSLEWGPGVVWYIMCARAWAFLYSSSNNNNEGCQNRPIHSIKVNHF